MKSWMRAFYAGTLSVLLSMLGLSGTADAADAAESAVQQQEEPQLSQILRAAMRVSWEQLGRQAVTVK
jgi:hypothetical protein